jgi:hypothetical protein
MDTFGSCIVTVRNDLQSGSYYDTSKTLQGAKNYATRHNLDNVYIRFNCGYHVECVAKKINNKWIKV